MLTTEAITIADAIAELDEQIDVLEDRRDELGSDSSDAEAIQSRIDRLNYLRDGLVWHRDEDWGVDAQIELGALDGGRKLLMHRAAPEYADREEMRFWWVAASTVEAPYTDGRYDEEVTVDDIKSVYGNLLSCAPAFVEWLEAKANDLSRPRVRGNETDGSDSSD